MFFYTHLAYLNAYIIHKCIQYSVSYGINFELFFNSVKCISTKEVRTLKGYFAPSPTHHTYTHP